jgi:hypothetical protein
MDEDMLYLLLLPGSSFSHNTATIPRTFFEEYGRRRQTNTKMKNESHHILVTESNTIKIERVC